ncbi:hypothetical protein K440DRAFT_280769 [Wilcoxina mikolae CBS 423.85]|nr:hypothetical protein K440DRAFT_280769 [Wilcoxina mikolae CBS 423.85]
MISLAIPLRSQFGSAWRSRSARTLGTILSFSYITQGLYILEDVAVTRRFEGRRHYSRHPEALGFFVGNDRSLGLGTLENFNTCGRCH